MPRDYLTDYRILKAVYDAHVEGNAILEAGRVIYLDMPHTERCVLNGSIRRLVDGVPKLGIVTALEVLAAASMIDSDRATYREACHAIREEAQHAND